MSNTRTALAVVALLCLALAARGSAQIAKPAAAHRADVRHAAVQHADSATWQPTMLHDVGFGALIGGFSGLLAGAIVGGTTEPSYTVCAPQPQGFGCPGQSSPPTALRNMAIGAVGGAILGAVMGAGYHQNRTAK